MKKIVLTLGIFLGLTSAAMAEGDVKISGSVELQYRHSSDHYAAKGDDDFKAEELYLKVEKEVADNIFAMIKLDGSDMDNKTGTASTHKNVEEAQVIFKNVANVPLTLIVGKAEMPFGQDYEKFLFNSLTHDLEIDKVWGIQGKYDIDGIGSLSAGFFERAPGTKFDNVSTTLGWVSIDNGQQSDKDVGITDSYAVKLKVDKLIENLSFEVSHAQIGKEESSTTEKDERRTSAGVKFAPGSLGLHAEYTTISDKGCKANEDLDVILAGADYKIGSWLMKARHEISDNDVDDDGSEEGRTAVGVSYYFNGNALIALEWETVSYDGSGKDDEDELLLGAKIAF